MTAGSIETVSVTGIGLQTDAFVAVIFLVKITCTKGNLFASKYMSQKRKDSVDLQLLLGYALCMTSSMHVYFCYVAGFLSAAKGKGLSVSVRFRTC
jgi:hypothetical protein